MILINNDISCYLYDRLNEIISNDNKLIFMFDDYFKYDVSNKYGNLSDIRKCIVNYNEGEKVRKEIIAFIGEKLEKHPKIQIHIDYSSMPRTWYYNLPVLLNEYLRLEDKVYFWYTVGKYPNDYGAYPSAGISSYSIIGNPTLRADVKRTHVIGLSYDKIRTQGIISILDPESFVVCNAYDPYHKAISENVKKLNEHIISQACMGISLRIDNFSLMISKMCEVANEFLKLGDVVFVPDGPKPLVFAISLIPAILPKIGISCIHISRNEQYFEPIDVYSAEVVYGFSVNGIKT